MLFFYNLVYFLFMPIIYPFVLVKSIKRGGFSLGKRIFFRVPESTKPVWIHCASIGEVNSLKPLVKKLEEKGKEVFITTLTDYGAERARSIFPSAKVSVLPLDIIPVIKRFVKKVNPEVVLIYETEIWPSLLYVLRKMDIPIFIVSGKISERSFKSYKILGKLFGYVLEGVSFLSKSELDAERAKRIGFSDVRVVGDLKFEVDIPEKVAVLEIEGERPVVLWGSTHEGEEKLAEEVHLRLMDKFPNLLTVVAPRHIGRARDLKFKIPYMMRTESRKVDEKTQIYVVDTIGELSSLYSYCDVAVIGGSFFPGVGGHNPIEAVVWKKPVVIGNYHGDFKHVVDELDEGIVVADRNSVALEIEKLLQSRELREEVSARAYIKLKENRGVVERILKEVLI